MEELTISEIKEYSFRVLCALKDVCEKNQISYSLTGGTLLGAVRHKGFIPWDDDIDIMIPRPDYDRLMKILKEDPSDDFRLLSYETLREDYVYAFAKACHPDTVLYETDRVQTKEKLGVYVDIFPIDGAGNTPFGAKVRVKTFQFLHGLKISSAWTSYHRSNLRKWYYEPLRYLCYIFSKILGRKLIDRFVFGFLKQKPFEKCAFAGRLVGDFGSREVMPRSLFEKKTKLTFEGESFDAIADYDTFLKNLYGDYLTLPPEEKQVTHHKFRAYRVKK